MVARGLEFDVSQRKSNKEKGESRSVEIKKQDVNVVVEVKTEAKHALGRKS